MSNSRGRREPVSREPSPEEQAIAKEEGGSSPLALSGLEKEVVDKTWRKMRRWKPHLYVTLRAYVDALVCRDDRTQYTHGVYRGFYAELAKKLGVDESTVKYRLKAGIKWFVKMLPR